MSDIDELDRLHADVAASTPSPMTAIACAAIVAAWPEVSARLRAAEAECERLRGVLRNVRDGYDCDEDAHKYGTPCRCCDARAALGEP